MLYLENNIKINDGLPYFNKLLLSIAKNGYVFLISKLRTFLTSKRCKAEKINFLVNDTLFLL